jgi:hypothetical protein
MIPKVLTTKQYGDAVYQAAPRSGMGLDVIRRRRRRSRRSRRGVVIIIIASIGWLIALVAVSILILPQPQSWENIVFGKKIFHDNDEFVYITGTLSGDRIAYRNNTVMIACYKNRKECLFSSVSQIGPDQIGRLDAPSFYPIVKWNTLEIMATESYANYCKKVTISIKRKSKTAVWVEEPVNETDATCKDFDTNLYKWTIEDSRNADRTRSNTSVMSAVAEKIRIWWKSLSSVITRS